MQPVGQIGYPERYQQTEKVLVFEASGYAPQTIRWSGLWSCLGRPWAGATQYCSVLVTVTGCDKIDRDLGGVHSTDELMNCRKTGDSVAQWAEREARFRSSNKTGERGN